MVRYESEGMMDIAQMLHEIGGRYFEFGALVRSANDLQALDVSEQTRNVCVTIEAAVNQRDEDLAVVETQIAAVRDALGARINEHEVYNNVAVLRETLEFPIQQRMMKIIEDVSPDPKAVRKLFNEWTKLNEQGALLCRIFGIAEAAHAEDA